MPPAFCLPLLPPASTRTLRCRSSSDVSVLVNSSSFFPACFPAVRPDVSSFRAFMHAGSRFSSSRVASTPASRLRPLHGFSCFGRLPPISPHFGRLPPTSSHFGRLPPTSSHFGNLPPVFSRLFSPPPAFSRLFSLPPAGSRSGHLSSLPRSDVNFLHFSSFPRVSMILFCSRELPSFAVSRTPSLIPCVLPGFRPFCPPLSSAPSVLDLRSWPSVLALSLTPSSASFPASC
jgi:hypothetical protein